MISLYPWQQPTSDKMHSILVSGQLLAMDFSDTGSGKGHGLPEPEPAKVLALIDGIREIGIEIRVKHNLERIIGK